MMSHHALSAPDDFSIFFALRWAPVRALGGGDRLAHAVVGTWLRNPQVDEPLWLSVAQFFVANPMLDPRQVGPIVDWIRNQRFVRELPEDAARVLGVAGPVVCVGTTTMNLTLRLPDAQQVRACKPDLAALAAWHPIGVTITAPGDQPGVDFVSRFFAPQSGIPEDPVTGSAHCTLAPYWASQTGKTSFEARQLSARGGELRAELRGDRVYLTGQAVTTMKGEFLLSRGT